VLFEMYVAKNVLNKFRQDHGYKEGSYHKVWNGREDNEVLAEIIRAGVVEAGAIYERLSSDYARVR